jgi:uncharacterized membrane-anchored protein YhcB (DUF1043 family)
MDILFVNLNWPVIVIVGIAVIILLVLINRRNLKDKQKMEQTLNDVDENREREGNDETKL